MPKEFPLPAFQRRFLESHPGENALLSVSFGASVDRARWMNAWALLVRNHAVLRTSFSSKGDVLFEHDTIEPSWKEPDFSEVPAAEIPGVWEAMQREEKNSLFSPGTFPLWRMSLIKLPGGGSHLLAAFHPALLDEPSISQLLLEWCLAYEGRPEVQSETALHPNPSVLLGGLELPESARLEDLFSHLPGDAANPLEFYSHGLEYASGSEAKYLSRSTELGAAFLGKLQTSEEEKERTIRKTAISAWALALAGLSRHREVFFVARENLREFFPAELGNATGFFLPDLPLRTKPPSDGAGLSEWKSQFEAQMPGVVGCVFQEWPASARSREQGGFTPATEILFRHGAVHDLLHKHFPQWLPLDAKWICPPTGKWCLVCESGKNLSATLYFEPSLLHPHAADLLLEAWRKSFLILSGGENSTLRETADLGATAPQGFALSSEPTLAEVLEQVFVEGGEAVLFEEGGTLWTSAQTGIASHQLARYLRRFKAEAGRPLLLCMKNGVLSSLVQLACVEDHIPLCIASPENLPDLLSKGNYAAAIVDAHSADATAGWEGKVVQLLQEWEKITQLSGAPLTPRRGPASGGIWFSVPAEEENAWSAEFLHESAKVSKNLLALDDTSRVFSTTASGTMEFLEEILSSVLSRACLVFPSTDVFATRSAFQEALLSGEVTHLCMDSPRWTNWVHFLEELRQTPPASLRCLVIRLAHFPKKALTAWARLSGDVRTLVSTSPWRLIGTGLVHEFTPERLKHAVESQPVVPLGSPVPGGEVRVLDLAGGNLAPGIVGDFAFFSSHEFAGRIGASQIQGFRSHSGEFYALEYPVFSGGALRQVNWRVRKALQQILDAREEVFDFLAAGSAEHPEELWVWLTMSDSASECPPPLLDLLARASLSGTSVTRCAVLPKLPCTGDGKIQAEELPPLTSLDELRKKQAAPSPSTAKSIAGSPTPAPSETFSLRTFHSGKFDSPSLILLGTTAHVETIAAQLARLLGEEFHIRIFQGEGDAALWSRSHDAKELFAKLRNFRMVAFGTHWQDAANICRLIGHTPQVPEELLCIAPTFPVEDQAEPGFSEKIQSFLGSMFSKQKNQSARKPGTARRKPKSCIFTAGVLFDGTPPEDLGERFPFGEFFDADLSNPETTASAICDVLLSKAGKEEDVEASTLEEGESADPVDEK